MENKEITKILWINGLKNAVEFGGIPNKKAVMGKLMAERKDLRSKTKIIIPLLDQILEEIESLNLEEQKKRLIQLDPNALEKKKQRQKTKYYPLCLKLINMKKL